MYDCIDLKRVNSEYFLMFFRIRFMRSGSIEVSTQTEKVFHTPDNHSGQSMASLNPWSLKCHKRQVAKMRRDNQDSDHYSILLPGL